MCCKVYMFEDKEGNMLYLNGSDSFCNSPDLMLKLYLSWYNNEFAPFETPPLLMKSFEDFKFVRSFCPIDFYDESIEIIRKSKES